MIKTLTLFILVTFSLVAPYIQSQTVQFNYTGSMQSWVVPPCVYTINVVIAGAKGGGTNGGNGARITANIAVTPGQTLYIYCGGMGNLGSNSGGWNGGGTGHNASGNYSSSDLSNYYPDLLIRNLETDSKLLIDYLSK
jgi:hypothetical protein